MECARNFMANQYTVHDKFHSLADIAIVRETLLLYNFAEKKMEICLSKSGFHNEYGL